MKIEGKKVKVNKSSENLYEFLLDPQNFKELMPENVETFEADDNGFVFALKGMPKVALKLEASNPYDLVEYSSAKENLNFYLKMHISAVNDQESELQIEFEGKFNPFIKSMLQKPLTNFIANLEENAAKLS